MVAECQAATIQEISQKCQNNTDDPQYHDRRWVPAAKEILLSSKRRVP